LNDDFSNHPRTIGEIRSDKTRKSQDWTVKEMLIAVLRKIDSGEIDPRMGSVVLGFGDDRGEQRLHVWYAGTRSIWEQRGMHSHAQDTD
jgi:hypothetical protein